MQIRRFVIPGLIWVLMSCSAPGPEKPTEAAVPVAEKIQLPDILDVLAERSAPDLLTIEPVPETEPEDAAIDPESEADKRAAEMYASALEAMRAGRDGEAETKFVEISQQFPEFSGPYVSLGIIYFRAEKNAQARAAFEKALELNPDSDISYNHLGILSRREGDFNKALDYYTNALAINLNYANAHLNMAILLELYLGKLSEALGHYKRYYQLTGEKDEEVNRWIIDLNRRISRQ